MNEREWNGSVKEELKGLVRDIWLWLLVYVFGWEEAPASESQQLLGLDEWKRSRQRQIDYFKSTQ